MSRLGLWYYFKGDPIKHYGLVMKFVEAGLSAEEVGRRLGVSGRCIKKFLSKWGMSSGGRRGPRHKVVVGKYAVKMRLYRWRRRMKEYLEEIGFWKLPYVIIDVKGQPHISTGLTLRSLIAVGEGQEQFLLVADRRTGEKVSAYVRKDHLEGQRKSLEKE